jgi:hypothetical protein
LISLIRSEQKFADIWRIRNGFAGSKWLAVLGNPNSRKPVEGARATEIASGAVKAEVDKNASEPVDIA